MNTIDSAVILAAGMGTRLASLSTKPKGLLTVGSSPALILRSIQALLDVGIQRILLVTGYGAAQYRDCLSDFPCVTTAHNAAFASTNTLHSLSCAEGWVNGSFLLLESDLLYPRAALEHLLTDTHHNTILVSSPMNIKDNVYVSCDREHHLISMSKQSEELSQAHILGEFVGINKISYPLFTQLCALHRRSAPETQYCYETDALPLLGREQPLFCHYVADLPWCEIDDKEQYAFATSCYPRILSYDTTGMSYEN